MSSISAVKGSIYRRNGTEIGQKLTTKRDLNHGLTVICLNVYMTQPRLVLSAVLSYLSYELIRIK